MNLYLSGGATNADPELSLGGPMSTVPASVVGIVSPLFGSLNDAERASGTTIYRCVYVVPTVAVSGLKFYVLSDTPLATTEIFLGWGSADEPVIASETTAPNGVSFESARTPATASSSGNFAAGQRRAMWIKLVVQPGSAKVTEQFGLSYVSDENVPISLTAPTISGSMEDGSTLTALTGTWLNQPTGFNYEWQESASGLSSWTNLGTESTFITSTAQVGKYIRVRIIPVNLHGVGEPAFSPVYGPVVTSDPVNMVLPVINGSPIKGQVLTVTEGVWSGNPTTFLYSWSMSANSVDWAPTGDTTSSLPLTLAHVGSQIRASVTGQRDTVSGAAAITLPTAIVADTAPPVPVNTALPTVSGGIGADFLLTSTTGTWANSPTSYTYQWQSFVGGIWTNISGATASTYVVEDDQTNTQKRVLVAGVNGSGSGVATASAALNFFTITNYGALVALGMI